MKTFQQRELRHAWPRLLALVAVSVGGCSSATSGHAPGVAGGETLTAGLTNYPLAYVKRPVPVADIDVRDLITSTPGGDLYIRDQASAGGMETNVTGGITKGMGDVRDLDVSPDGTKVVFSLRLPLIPNATADKQPTWKIYEYDAVAKTVRQVTTDDITQGHDVGPHYLPDGRIVFASTRQTATQAILLDEGRPQYQAQTDDRTQSIFLLHVVNADGTNIHQISFNTNHDFAPSVLGNGQVVFSRWEVTNGVSQISLYRTNPDGTGLELYYGANSHATGASISGVNNNVIQFLNARQRPDGKLLAIDRPFLGTQLGGDVLLIDAENFVEIHQPSSPTGPAGTAQASATTLGVTTDANLPSLGGRFASAYPLYDGTNRMLVSWSPCLVLNTSVTPPAAEVCTAANTTGPAVQLAPPQYTLWIYDLDAGTLSPLLSSDPGTMIVDPVILQARSPAPTFIADFVPTGLTASDSPGTMANNGVGLLVIGSVYDVDGVDTATPNIATLADPSQSAFYQRPNRFIRIEKAVEIPAKTVRKLNTSAFGPQSGPYADFGTGMREILGYAPIQPDGSVQIQVPAEVPFTIEILDQNAQRIPRGTRHTSWMQLMPGEVRTCNGCHSTAAMRAKPSHGRCDPTTGVNPQCTLTVPVNPGAPAANQPFPNTNPSLPAAAAGQTMAQTLALSGCTSANSTTCSETLSSDVIYTNVWTSSGVTPPAGEQDTSFSYLYANLNTPAPINANCVPWSAQCRSTIEYPLQLQPVWNLTRPPSAASTTPNTCVSCHTSMGSAGTLQAFAAMGTEQLDLTGGQSNVDTTVVVSYEQLLFPHDEQTFNMGSLQEYFVPGPIDPATGLPTMVPVSLGASVVAGSANASSMNFFRLFDGTYHDPVVDHTGYLTPAELRLISEWLDMGAQYYNDPFVAPAAN